MRATNYLILILIGLFPTGSAHSSSERERQTQRHFIPIKRSPKIWANRAPTETSHFQYHIPNQMTDWSETLTIPRFNPRLGVLKSVKLNLTGNARYQFRSENLDTVSSSVFFTESIRFEASSSCFPSCAQPMAHTIAQWEIQNELTTPKLSAFDGNLDYSGTSGFISGWIEKSQSRELSWSIDSNPEGLPFFLPEFYPNSLSESDVSPREMSLVTQTTFRDEGPGSLAATVQTESSAEAQLDYVYAPPRCARPSSYWSKYYQKRFPEIQIGKRKLEADAVAALLRGKPILPKSESESSCGRNEIKNPNIKLAQSYLAALFSIRSGAQYAYILRFLNQAQLQLESANLASLCTQTNSDAELTQVQQLTSLLQDFSKNRFFGSPQCRDDDEEEYSDSERCNRS